MAAGSHLPPPPLDPSDENYVPDHVAEQADPLKEYNIEQARTDINAFIEYVIRDETTNEAVKQAPLHETWQYLFAQNKFISIWAAMEHGKTTQILSYVLFNLGRNPNLRVIIVSKTDGLAKKLISALERYIEESDELHEVFPELVPGEQEQDVWSAVACTVKRPNKFIRDPSVQAFGLGGTPTGARCDLLIFDDLLSIDNVSTPELREKVWEAVQNKYVSRMTKQGQAISIGTPYHPEDFLHRLEETNKKLAIWKTFKFPAINPKTWDAKTIAWPERWTVEGLREKQRRAGSLAEFARQMLCEARDDSNSQFREVWITDAKGKGTEFEFVHTIDPYDLPPGYFIVSGVDLAVKKGLKNDLSVISTLLVYPNFWKQLLWIESGQWSAHEIVDRIHDTHYRYQGFIFVENNAAQDYILQFAEGTPATILPFTTGRNKADPQYGIEGLARTFFEGKWIFPSPNPGEEQLEWELEQLIQQMLYYRRGAHTGDHLMSLWMAHEGARRLHAQTQGRGGLSVRMIGEKMGPQLAEEREKRLLESYFTDSRIVED